MTWASTIWVTWGKSTSEIYRILSLAPAVVLFVFSLKVTPLDIFLPFIEILVKFVKFSSFTRPYCFLILLEYVYLFPKSWMLHCSSNWHHDTARIRSLELFIQVLPFKPWIFFRVFTFNLTFCIFPILFNRNTGVPTIRVKFSEFKYPTSK